MASLDGFIVLVAVPAIQADLHVTGAAIQLIVVGHGLTYAIGLITGRLVQGIGSALMYPADLRDDMARSGRTSRRPPNLRR